MSWGKRRGFASLRAATPLLAAGVVLLSAFYFHGQQISQDLQTPRDLHHVGYIGADSCRRCHEDHFESWARTFHRTMTQDVRITPPRAGFDATDAYEYGGVVTEFTLNDAGLPMMNFDGWDYEGQSSFEITRTVGSRRYQQFLAPTSGGELVRLPIAWDIEGEDFFHLNGAFLTPDPEGLSVGRDVTNADYGKHAATWNDNCLFCHNVGVNPGLQSHGAFETEFAELGIACEACHGPGEAHSEANADPMRRYWLHHSDSPDPTIVNPERLSASRSNDVCGRCHGQRLSDDIHGVLANGDPFIPGDILDATSEPLWRDTTLNGQPNVFALRFWPDGAPRLTAYEYQGLLQSRCSLDDEFACTTCHGMHEGDPRGQLRPEAETAAVCNGCHEDIDAAHSRHAPEQPGSACVDCHMPKTVYGIVTAHRNHRIDSPSMIRQSVDDRPDACTTCHLDESAVWTQEWLDEWWPGNATHRTPEPLPTQDVPIHRLRLFGGDPIVRALAAHHAGYSTVFARQTSRSQRIGDLIDVMRNDPYPGVRRIAVRSLRLLLRDAPTSVEPVLQGYDPEGTRASRVNITAALQDLLPREAWIAPDPDWATEQRSRAATVNIEIGE